MSGRTGDGEAPPHERGREYAPSPVWLQSRGCFVSWTFQGRDDRERSIPPNPARPATKEVTGQPVVWEGR
jgi:hypothetical protein